MSITAQKDRNMITFDGVQDLIALLEQKAADARARIGKTRTKLESHELKGEVYAFNEAIFFVKEFARNQEIEDGSPDEMESVDIAKS